MTKHYLKETHILMWNATQKLIETITLPITSGNWHYSRIWVIGNVVDSITEPRERQLQLLFIMTYKK